MFLSELERAPAKRAAFLSEAKHRRSAKRIDAGKKASASEQGAKAHEKILPPVSIALHTLPHPQPQTLS